MVELFYVQRALKSKAKIRWLVRALKLSRFKDVPALLSRIDAKVIRAIKRKGELAEEETFQIIENILWAKLFRRLQKWKLKTYQPHLNDCLPEWASVQADPISKKSCATVFKEHHYRFQTKPAILIPGFVPEGNEAYYLLRHSFLRYGSTYYINFPKEHYQNDVIFHQLYHLVTNINQRTLQTAGRKQAPFLVGTSFGCAVILNFLKWIKEKNLEETIELSGIVFLSPVWCMQDVCVPGAKKQPTLVARAIAPLFELDENDHDQITKAMIRARGIFSKMFKAGQKQLDASKKQRIPVLAIEEEVIEFFNIEDAKLHGYFKRYLCLRNAGTPKVEHITDLPVLSLIAEGEKDVLTPSSPALQIHDDLTSFKTLFPNGEIQHVASQDPTRRVTHSDLIFNADCYRAQLDPWLKRRRKGNP